MGMKDTLRHAFAVDPPGPAEPTPEEQVPVDWLCRQVAKRHLTTPGLLALEMSRPLNWVTAQFMHGVSPFVWAVMPKKKHEYYEHLVRFLERRGAIDYIASRVEHFEAEFDAAPVEGAGATPGARTDREEDHDDN